VLGEPSPSPLAAALDPARGRDARTASLGLFVLDGFVWGADAGDETRGEARTCWCISSENK
jgi:hypothetical protein